jgi:hypothetical protein
MEKTIKLTRIVEYWGCNDPSHFHKKESSAQACIDRAEARAAVSARTNAAINLEPAKKASHIRWTKLALFRMDDLSAKGATVSDLAKRYRLSKGRIHERLKTAKRVRRYRAALRLSRHIAAPTLRYFSP